MKMLLIADGLWDCVEGIDTDASRDRRALSRICLSIQPGLYQYVRDCTTSKDAWRKLADSFEDRGLYRRVLLLRQLHRVEYNNFASMSDYIEGVMKLVQQLSDIGKNIEDDEIAEILLSGLPQEYEVLVSGLETACIASRLTSELVRTRLLQEDHRRKNETQSMAYVAARKRSTPVICHYCKKTGHFANKCFKKRRDRKQDQPAKEHAFYASAMVASSSEEFVIDSGASVHMCANEDMIMDIKNRTCTITVANGQELVSTKNEANDSCVACLSGKMHVKPLPQTQIQRTVKSLDLIHADVCGPMQVSTWGGARYLLMFTDDYTRKTFGYLMKAKSELRKRLPLLCNPLYLTNMLLAVTRLMTTAMEVSCQTILRRSLPVQEESRLCLARSPTGLARA